MGWIWTGLKTRDIHFNIKYGQAAFEKCISSHFYPVCAWDIHGRQGQPLFKHQSLKEKRLSTHPFSFFPSGPLISVYKKVWKVQKDEGEFTLNSMDGVRNVFSCKTLTAMQDVWEVRFRFLGKTSMYLEMQLKENYLNWAVFVLAEKCRTDHMVGDVRGQLLGRRWLCWQPDFSQMKPLMIKTFSLLPTIQLMWCQALATDEDQHIHTHLLT